MQQLSIFDTERPVGFLNRWHLYRDDQLMYTCIPSQRCVTLIGLPLPMKNTKEILRLSDSEYKQCLKDNNYEEVGME